MTRATCQETEVHPTDRRLSAAASRQLDRKRPDIHEHHGNARGEHSDEVDFGSDVDVLSRLSSDDPLGSPHRLVEVVRVAIRGMNQ